MAARKKSMSFKSITVILLLLSNIAIFAEGKNSISVSLEISKDISVFNITKTGNSVVLEFPLTKEYADFLRIHGNFDRINSSNIKNIDSENIYIFYSYLLDLSREILSGPDAMILDSKEQKLRNKYILSRLVLELYNNYELGIFGAEDSLYFINSYLFEGPEDLLYLQGLFGDSLYLTKDPNLKVPYRTQSPVPNRNSLGNIAYSPPLQIVCLVEYFGKKYELRKHFIFVADENLRMEVKLIKREY